MGDFLSSTSASMCWFMLLVASSQRSTKKRRKGDLLGPRLTETDLAFQGQLILNRKGLVFFPVCAEERKYWISSQF